eukprot:PhM_4_TR16079/c7_g4_i5/m.94272
MPMLARLTIAGQPIPVVEAYKYLGVLALSWEADFKKRKSNAWCALRKLKEVWMSRQPEQVKRQLFAALVEPIFTYGLHLWPSSVQRINAMHSAYSRMLRYALGLPPAIASFLGEFHSRFEGRDFS